MKILNGTLPFFVVLASSSIAPAWSQPEAVTGHFDQANDWFVFDWVNPQTGKQEAIYDSGNKIKPAMHANVSFDASGIGTYSYQVTNLNGAVQLLDDILVAHRADVSEAKSPEPKSEWYSTEYRPKRAWSWSKIRGAVKGIPSGQTVSGFTFKSKGLPTIVDAWFAGKRRAQYRFPSPDDDTEEAQASFERVFTSLQARYPNKFIDTVLLKTIGPIDPPVNFVATDFIQNLLSLEAQSASAGWIPNQGILKSLEAKLGEARKKIEAGDTPTARNILTAFLAEVTAQKDKQLTSEAYALLYFNGTYLINNLPTKAVPASK
jgi:hypothetical protein